MSNFKNCKVDCVHISLKYTADSTKKISFDEILKHEEINGKEFYIRGKSIHFSIIEDNEEYTIGFIRTIIDKDLPAKIHKKNKQISALDLSSEEGIAFGNVLLFSKKLNVLFYEVNKNSIYLDMFKKFIYTCFHSSVNLKEESIFDIRFSTIFKKNEYLRALKMDKYKSFKLKVYQPKNLLREFKNLNSTLEDRIDFEFMSELDKAANLNSDFAEIEYRVQNPKKTGGLYRNKIEPLIEGFGRILKFNQIRENIQSVEICGYNNEFSTSQIPIDLVGDVYFTKFKIETPRLDKDLQKKQRVEAIKNIYISEFSILEDYL